MADEDASQDLEPSASFSSAAYYDSDDAEFLEALKHTVLPGDAGYSSQKKKQDLDKLPAPVKSAGAGQPASSSTTVERGRPQTKRRREPSLSRSRSRSQPRPEKGSLEDTYGKATFGDFGEYMRRKRAKLQIQNAEMSGAQQTVVAGKRGIFHGIAIYINGWTDPSVQVLRELIVKHGGVFQPYLVRKDLVTHIITCSLTPAKVHEFQHMKVVTPAWLLESAKQGVLLPWRNFIYKPGNRSEKTQGAASSQAKLSDLYDDLYKTQQDDDMDGEVDIDMDKLMNLEVERPPESQLDTPATFDPGPSISSTSELFMPRPASKFSEQLDASTPVTTVHTARVPGYAAHKSNPNASRLMSDPAWRAAHTSAAPGFMVGYYKHSRLHHLSTWKAELRQLVAAAQERNGASAAAFNTGNAQGGTSMKGVALVLKSPSRKDKGKGRAHDSEEKVIMHCDFDCFFVSAGLLERPHLRGRPIVVCHSQGAQGGMGSTSEIASASYEARSAGVRNGMSLQQARKLCPTVMTIPYEFEKYKDISLKFYTVLMEYADDLEAVSVDEALIDVTTAVQRWSQSDPGADSAKSFADHLRQEVKLATACEVSIGIAHNILLARLATRRAKPAGSHHLTMPDVPLFLAPLDIADLPGFGHSAKQKILEKHQTSQLGDLLQRSKGELCAVLGAKTGEKLFNALRGVDDRVLDSEKKRSSVSTEINYGIRFETDQQAEAFVFQMADEVSRRLKDIQMVGRAITLKLMKRDPNAPVEAPKFLGHGKCEVFNKQSPLSANGRATDDARVIGDHACRLLRGFAFDSRELRGVGIHITKLEPASETQTGQGVNGGGIAKPTSTRGRISEQGKLPFAPRASPKKARMATHSPPRRKATPALPASASGSGVAAESSKEKRADYDDLPSFSQVDRSVFNALPHDLQAELQAEYQRRSTTPAVGRARNNARSTSPKKPQASKFAQKHESSMSKFLKRIAAQLGMETRGPAAGASKRHALVVLGAKRRQRARFGLALNLGVPQSELVELGIDPEVFSVLPPGVQREQLILARYIKKNGKMPEAPKNRKMLKPQWKVKGKRVIIRLPMPKARWFQPPMLKQRSQTSSKGKEKATDDPQKASRKNPPGPTLYFSHTGDVQSVIGRWVSGLSSLPPKERDIESFRKWVIRSLGGSINNDGSINVGSSDMPNMTDTRQERVVHMDYTGLERVRSVLMWWRVLLRRHWPECEWTWDAPEEELNGLTYPRAPGDECMTRYWDVGGEDDTGTGKDSDAGTKSAGVPIRTEVGNAWWQALMKVKEAADELASRRFGGTLALG
ncbi:hypothetical protein HGRIS_013738 [Hohenbuehelia grisea]|uniref:DNA repair protein REV1 n=1 Tax=Hohenbuehelia grisea TaxID=104357 RepID=A0ABR3IWQ9_9AGAR